MSEECVVRALGDKADAPSTGASGSPQQLDNNDPPRWSDTLQWHSDVTFSSPPSSVTPGRGQGWPSQMMLISFVRDVKNICSALKDPLKEIGENLRWIKIWWLFRLCLSSSCAAAGQLRTRGTFKPQSSRQGWSYHCWRCQPNHNIYQSKHLKGQLWPRVSKWRKMSTFSFCVMKVSCDPL